MRIPGTFGSLRATSSNRALLEEVRAAAPSPIRFDRYCGLGDREDDILSITNEGLGRAFMTALLLTASAERAEASVLEAIGAMDPLEASDGALLREATAASIAAKLPEARVEEQEHGSSLLPLELRGVLRLSRNLRHCFVLRVLVGLPRAVCALMLQTGTRQRIDELVCNSVQALAVLSVDTSLLWGKEGAN